MMCYGLRLNWNYRKQRFCNPHFTCKVYGSYNGGAGAHPVTAYIAIFLTLNTRRRRREQTTITKCHKMFTK